MLVERLKLQNFLKKRKICLRGYNSFKWQRSNYLERYKLNTANQTVKIRDIYLHNSLLLISTFLHKTFIR